MSKLLNEIHDYLESIGFEEDFIKKMDNNPILLSEEICIYAHKNQKRLNGESYIKHPFSLFNLCDVFFGIKNDDVSSIHPELLEKYGIVLYGVKEVCLLHDVIEDTNLEMEDIENLFIECGLEGYFKTFIETPLKLITHKKSDDYDEYISQVLKHPTSSLVKMLDLYDNLNPISLNQLNEKEEKRMIDYLSYIIVINRAYDFVNNVNKYKREFKNDKKD